MRWGTITAVSPLRVRLDGDEDPLPFTPDSLIDALVLELGDRVRCEISGRVVIVGKAGGTPFPDVAAEIASALTAWAPTHVPGTPMIPSSVVVGSGSASVAADGTVTLTGASSVSPNDVLTSGRCLVFFDIITSAAATLNVRLRASGTDSSTGYDTHRFAVVNTTATPALTLDEVNWVGSGGVAISGARHVGVIDLSQAAAAIGTVGILRSTITANPMTTDSAMFFASLLHRPTSAFTGISFIAGSGTLSGTVRVVAA